MSDYKSPDVYAERMMSGFSPFGRLWEAFEDDNVTDIAEHGGGGPHNPSKWLVERPSYVAVRALLGLPRLHRMTEAAMHAFPSAPDAAADFLAYHQGGDGLREDLVEVMQRSGVTEALVLLDIESNPNA